MYKMQHVQINCEDFRATAGHLRSAVFCLVRRTALLLQATASRSEELLGLAKGGYEDLWRAECVLKELYCWVRLCSLICWL